MPVGGAWQVLIDTPSRACVCFWENWKCCAQRAVSRSSAEAEYMAFDVGVKTSIYLRNLLQEMGINVGLVTLRSDSIEEHSRK